MTYSPFRHIDSIAWKKKPIQLTLFLTRRCNARCAFCFYLSDKRAEQSQQQELSLDEIKKISASAGKLLWLAFSGGEIFLRDDIVDIAKTFYDNNRPSIILFPTNGLLTDVIRKKTESILKYCTNSTIVTKLSLEGTESIHDSIRGKGSFKKTMDTYTVLGELLAKYPHFDLGINTVFSSANQDSIDDLTQFVNGLDRIKTHTVSLIRGSVADNSLKAVDIEKYLDTINRLDRNLKKKTASQYRFRGAKLKAAQDILQRRIIYETFVQKRQLLPCYAGKLNLVITETGDLYPCESFSMRMGNVRDSEYNIKKMLTSAETGDILRSIKERKCYCTHECYVMTNILFNPAMYPSLLKEYIKLR
jgi:radical SAM protein with 4Fe4S-binding SPASM domain